MSVRRFWRTVRHLRIGQIYHRLLFRLIKPTPDLGAAPPISLPGGPWVQTPAVEASMTGPERFVFLNERGSLAEHGWDTPGKAKLWRYNLHYFDDLVAQGASRRSSWHSMLIARWIAENPPGQGTGWEPYPLSKRIINWIKWSLAGGTLDETALHSLAVQARWLTKRIEWHLLGNHLFLNAKALIFAGSFFGGEEGQHWRNLGWAIAGPQLREQFLSDGAQFELSPMYHALAVEDLLDLVNVVRAFPDDNGPSFIDEVHERAACAIQWLSDMSHPDGAIAFFNDAAFGIAPANAALYDYSAALGVAAPVARPAVHHSAASGYVRMENAGFFALIDLAAVGPDYLPGHAHADTLSLEFSLGTERVFVNSGTSVYGEGAERLRQRGTAAHNTVVLGGKDSSEVWAGFRVGRRARVHDVASGQGDGEGWCSGWHDGYGFLPGKPRHARRVVVRSDALTVQDRVDPPIESAQARFHIHPHVAVIQKGLGHWLLVTASGAELEVRADVQAGWIEPTTWHPGFGTTVPSQCLVVPLVGGHSEILVAKV